MKRALAAAVAAGVITAAGITAAWQYVLRDFDRIADGPDPWDDAHRHLERFWGDA